MVEGRAYSNNELVFQMEMASDGIKFVFSVHNTSH